jgi:LmbE family N-acetylglucosaminyl deacetylase
VHTALVISPHADDAAAFCGGTIAKFAAAGWRVVIVRVTDDATDSVGLDMTTATVRNFHELRDAAKIMGASEVVELDYQTDTLAKVSHVEMRKRMVFLFRKYRPYAVFSFDPDDLGEDNVDHIVVARAVAEAFWVAQFDLHHPEHIEAGFKPHAVCEKWYYGRTLPHANHAEDITEFIERKVDALAAHKTAMKNALNQFRMQLETYGRRMPFLEDAIQHGARPVLDLFLKEQAREVAALFHLGEDRYAERFRLVRFGAMEGLVRHFSEPIPGAPEPPKRDSLDRDA